MTSSIPFVKGQPLLGHFRSFKTDVLGTLNSIAQNGPLTRFKLLWADNYLVADPHLADEVYLNKAGTFIKNPHFWGRHTDVFGNGLLVSEGVHWKKARKIVSPAFRRDAVYRYFDGSLPIIDAEIACLKGHPVDLRQFMLRVTSRIATNALFGTVVNSDNTQAALACIEEQFSQRMKRPFAFQDRLPTPKNVRFQYALKTLENELLLAIMKAKESTRPTALSALVAAAEQGDLTDTDIRDEAVTLFLAGHETTATTLTFAVALLALHPAILADVQAEARALWQSNPSPIDLFGSSRLLGVIKETLRLLPPAYIFGRLTTEDAPVGDFVIPAKKTVVISPYVFGQNPQLFPAPETFNPSRWTPEFEASLPRAAFSPFGGGPRICAGEHFAYLQVALVLSRLLSSGTFQFEATPSLAVRPWITLLPRQDLTVHFGQNSI